ncbi:hypothetical protein N7463_004386 [Penicillium fimorum]|uniref:Uncharacterized protein n=1 Tax=Penicillium fimorum TaxID=1882269 RepID=A0A9X0CAS6_9EURO|nr:hypothetical protein N7463_004386 [Penicillium fimorum]
MKDQAAESDFWIPDKVESCTQAWASLDKHHLVSEDDRLNLKLSTQYLLSFGAKPKREKLFAKKEASCNSTGARSNPPAHNKPGHRNTGRNSLPSMGYHLAPPPYTARPRCLPSCS